MDVETTEDYCTVSCCIASYSSQFGRQVSIFSIVICANGYSLFHVQMYEIIYNTDEQCFSGLRKVCMSAMHCCNQRQRNDIRILPSENDTGYDCPERCAHVHVDSKYNVHFYLRFYEQSMGIVLLNCLQIIFKIMYELVYKSH